MHLRNAHLTLTRLAAGIVSTVLAMAAQSAFADPAAVTVTTSAASLVLHAPITAPATTSLTSTPTTASTTPLTMSTSLAAGGSSGVTNAQAVAVAPPMMPTSFAADATTAALAQAAAAVQSTTDSSTTPGHGSFLAGVASKAGDVVVGALNLIGVRYRWGGDSPDSGLDCSGFVRYIFRDTLNVTLPRTASDMSRVGEKVKFSDLKPGDLVFFNTARRAISHVGIYIGHDKFVHSPSTGSTIRVDEMNDRYWETRYRGARRLSAVDGSEDDSTPADIAQRLQAASHVAY